MKKRYVVFWMDKVRHLYGDDSYNVIGEWMKSFDTKLQAIEYIKSLKLKERDACTILEVYSGR